MIRAAFVHTLELTAVASFVWVLLLWVDILSH
jgi:hypothetical protein